MGVIPKARAFTSGPGDLACSTETPREIPRSASLREPPAKAGSTKNGLARDDATGDEDVVIQTEPLTNGRRT
jgi:hypothetical protein